MARPFERPFAFLAQCVALAFLVVGGVLVVAPQLAEAQTAPSIPFASSSPGGLSESAADALYLRLDTSNDPLTAHLDTDSVDVSGILTVGTYITSDTGALSLSDGNGVNFPSTSLYNSSGDLTLNDDVAITGELTVSGGAIVAPGLKSSDSGWGIFSASADNALWLGDASSHTSGTAPIRIDGASNLYFRGPNTNITGNITSGDGDPLTMQDGDGVIMQSIDDGEDGLTVSTDAEYNGNAFEVNVDSEEVFTLTSVDDATLDEVVVIRSRQVGTNRIPFYFYASDTAGEGGNGVQSGDDIMQVCEDNDDDLSDGPNACWFQINGDGEIYGDGGGAAKFKGATFTGNAVPSATNTYTSGASGAEWSATWTESLNDSDGSISVGADLVAQSESIDLGSESKGWGEVHATVLEIDSYIDTSAPTAPSCSTAGDEGKIIYYHHQDQAPAGTSQGELCVCVGDTNGTDTWSWIGALGTPGNGCP